MTMTEKLAQLEASEEKNRRAATIHHTIEIYARGTLSSLDILAQYHGVDRGELLELLVNTLWAMQQSDEQEG